MTMTSKNSYVDYEEAMRKCRGFVFLLWEHDSLWLKFETAGLHFPSQHLGTGEISFIISSIYCFIPATAHWSLLFLIVFLFCVVQGVEAGVMTGKFDDFSIDLHVLGSRSLNIRNGNFMVFMFSLDFFFWISFKFSLNSILQQAHG